MAPRSVAHEETILHELKTILMLEETLGVKGIRQLRAVVRDDAGRELVDELVRGAADTTRDLDEVIATWSRLSPDVSAIHHEAPGPMDREEIVTSFVELKESEAAMLRRAAENSPDDVTRHKLRRLADRQDATARRLRDLL